jgi:hypothetical protein
MTHALPMLAILRTAILTHLPRWRTLVHLHFGYILL